MVYLKKASSHAGRSGTQQRGANGGKPKLHQIGIDLVLQRKTFLRSLVTSLRINRLFCSQCLPPTSLQDQKTHTWHTLAILFRTRNPLWNSLLIVDLKKIKQASSHAGRSVPEQRGKQRKPAVAPAGINQRRQWTVWIMVIHSLQFYS